VPWPDHAPADDGFELQGRWPDSNSIGAGSSLAQPQLIATLAPSQGHVKCQPRLSSRRSSRHIRIRASARPRGRGHESAFLPLALIDSPLALAVARRNPDGRWRRRRYPPAPHRNFKNCSIFQRSFKSAGSCSYAPRFSTGPRMCSTRAFVTTLK